MHNENDLCEKIRAIFPEIGECGGEVDVNYDTSRNAYAVDLKRGHTRLKTYLEPEDASTCMEGERCVSLGIQVSQLVNNVDQV